MSINAAENFVPLSLKSYKKLKSFYAKDGGFHSLEDSPL